MSWDQSDWVIDKKKKLKKNWGVSKSIQLQTHSVGMMPLSKKMRENLQRKKEGKIGINTSITTHLQQIKPSDLYHAKH